MIAHLHRMSGLTKSNCRTGPTDACTNNDDIQGHSENCWDVKTAKDIKEGKRLQKLGANFLKMIWSLKMHLK